MKRFYILAVALCAMCVASQARVVTGSVKSGSKKLSGVVVSDGKSFTQTKNNGKFQFDIADDAEFVFIITPAGYVADWSSGVPEFYQRAEGKNVFDFDLQPYGKGNDDYHIIAVGDPQPRSDAHFEEFADIPLEDLVTTASSLDAPAYGVVLGDICFDVLHLHESWKKEIVRAGIPFYPVVGNHDHDKKYKNDIESIAVYRKNFGPENYAFMLGNDLMIVLDNIIYHARSSYEEGYTDAIVEWVAGLMKFIPADADVYVSQHCTLNGRHYGKMVTNHDKMLDALEGHKVTFLSGHNHTSGYFEYAEGVSEHNIAAICGTWWDAYHCTDGTPRGYKVFTMKDNHLSWYYKSIGRDRSFQFEVYKPGTTRLNPESLVVNVWDYDPCWRVELYEDGKYRGIMKQVDEYSPLHSRDMEEKYKKLGRKFSDYKKTRLARHYFALTPLPDTEKATIVVKDRFGNVWKEDVLLK